MFFVFWFFFLSKSETNPNHAVGEASVLCSFLRPQLIWCVMIVLIKKELDCYGVLSRCPSAQPTARGHVGHACHCGIHPTFAEFCKYARNKGTSSLFSVYFLVFFVGEREIFQPLVHSSDVPTIARPGRSREPGTQSLSTTLDCKNPSTEGTASAFFIIFKGFYLFI